MQIRRLTPADAPAYRVLRLRALREHPQSYTSSFDEEQGKPLANYEQRLAGVERLYLDAGFASFGVEPGAIKVDNQFLDKNHMFLRLAPS